MRDIILYNELEKKINDNPQLFADTCEQNYHTFLDATAKKIIDENIKTIYICGQSSSGKTTTTNRLKLRLEKAGLVCHTIELDDFFLPKEELKKNKNGLLDFDTVFALDLEAIYSFKKDIDLGKEVSFPEYNFINKSHSKGEKIAINKEDTLIIEGIHSFNNRILKTFGEANSLKIFITVNTDIKFYDTFINANDLRFLRRLIRDNNYRNAKPSLTIKLWKLVRSGEKRYSKDYIKRADLFFNTFLNYEPFVLRNEAIKLIMEGISSCNEKRYFKILKNKVEKFKEIGNIEISKHSILNEFI
jgi:uridine kinase